MEEMIMSSRCIMVLSTLRSGSSCVSGVLHRLGVDMGAGHFQPADKNNQTGYHEDLRWSAITKRITGGRYYHDAFQPDEIPIEASSQYWGLTQQMLTREIWGIKSPRMALVAHWIWPYLDDCRIVVMHRQREQSIASLMRHSKIGYSPQYRLTKDKAAKIIDLHLEAVQRRLKEFNGTTLCVPYSELLIHPQLELGRLVDFCFVGKEHLTPGAEKIQAVAKWIDPALDHHDGGS